MKQFNAYYEEEHHLVMDEDYKTSLWVAKIFCDKLDVKAEKRKLAKKGYREGTRDTGRDNYMVSKIRFEEVIK